MKELKVVVTSLRKCAVFILCCSPLNLITIASSCSWWLTCGAGGEGTARCTGEQNMRFPDGSGTDVTAEIANSQHTESHNSLES